MTNEPVGARDQRPPSLGLGRIIIALFWLLGAWILVTAILDLFHAQGQPWGPRIVALLAGIDYLIAATALTHNSARSAWTGFGVDFYYLPLIVSIIGLIWMWRSNPRRIVSLAEQVERPSVPWRAH